MLFIPGTPLKTNHLQSIKNSIGGAEFRTLGPVASIRLKKKTLGEPAGAEFRTLGPMATGGGKQPTFCTARAQRTVRPQNSEKIDSDLTGMKNGNMATKRQ